MIELERNNKTGIWRRKKMIGIYDCFGYGTGYDVSFEERYRLIKEAGFDCVMLWWSDKFGRGDDYKKDVKFAKNAGLYIENIIMVP